MNTRDEVKGLLLNMMKEIDTAKTDDQVEESFNYTIDIISSMIDEKDMDHMDLDTTDDVVYDDVYELMKAGKL